jgi:hypothetical protein
MLISRSVLFILAQSLIALVLAGTGAADPWYAAAGWWTFMAILANIASMFLLVYVFRLEGKRFLDILRFRREGRGKDLLYLLATIVIGLPLAAIPMNILAASLFNDPLTPVHMMFRPLPLWAFILSFLFPLTIAFAELPTYFGYVMPRLAAQLKNGWLAWVLASFFLGTQHAFLPLLFDGRFFLWRLGAYMLFAFFTGLMLKLRPSLMPYAVIIHALADVSAVLVYLSI